MDETTRHVGEGKHGLLLVAHGSGLSGSQAAEEVLRIAAGLRTELGLAVAEVGFLAEEPGIEEGVRRCVRQGVTDLTVAPYFLTEGYLMKKALRLAFAEAKKHPLRTVQSTQPLGLHQGLIDVVLDRIREADESV
jgi:sirohydrochlorin cobaltochelatase